MEKGELEREVQILPLSVLESYCRLQPHPDCDIRKFEKLLNDSQALCFKHTEAFKVKSLQRFIFTNHCTK